MPLSEEEKQYVVDAVVEILRSPDKQERIAELRARVMDDSSETHNILDDAVYSMLQAIEELYG